MLDEYARSLPDAAISLIDIDGMVIVSAGDVPDHHQALSVGLINKGEMAGQLVSQLRIEPQTLSGMRFEWDADHTHCDDGIAYGPCLLFW